MGDVIWQARHSPLSKELHGWLNHPLNCKLNLKLFTLVLFRDKISKMVTTGKSQLLGISYGKFNAENHATYKLKNKTNPIQVYHRHVEAYSHFNKRIIYFEKSTYLY